LENTEDYIIILPYLDLISLYEKKIFEIEISKCIKCSLISTEESIIKHCLICQMAVTICDYCNEETKIKDLETHLISCNKKIKKTFIFNENNSESDKKSLKLSSLNDIKSVILNQSISNKRKSLEIDNIIHKKNKSNCSSLSVEYEDINENANYIFSEKENKTEEKISSNTKIIKDNYNINTQLNKLEKKVKILEKSIQINLVYNYIFYKIYFTINYSILNKLCFKILIILI
jgi:hypothetical protein